MTDELLPYYNRELTHIRRLAAEFAEANPKIAGRLRLSRDAVEDPHVARLIEAFAFLNARISHKLDDEFPELTDALLGVLYPHYLAPVPSMTIVQFNGQPDLPGVFVVPAGTELDTEPVQGETCRYRTCYPATLWPVAVDAMTLSGRPLVAPPNPRAAEAMAVLRLSLRCLDPSKTFAQLQPDALRFYLRGQPQQVYPLYELIFANTVSVALADSVGDPRAVIVGPDAIQPVGFGAEEGMLPYPARSPRGYRLLTEYFVFPEKFLFFDLTKLSAKTLMAAGNRMEVFFYLNRTIPELERSLSVENIALGCAPAVNLFRQRAEPIALSRALPDYRIVPDARRVGATEVYAVESVRVSRSDGAAKAYQPFYSLRHAGGEEDGSAYWYAARRPAAGRDPGSEMYLSLVDLDFNPSAPDDATASVEITTFNRDLPARLPYGGGHPYLTPVQGLSAVKTMVCVAPPTQTLRISSRQSQRWRLLSHLMLNHLSLSDGGDGLDALKEILRLYDFRDSAGTRALIDGITDLRIKRGAARAPAEPGAPYREAFCRGTDVSIEFDPARYSGGGLYLLAAVIEHFLGLYCSINSFTRLTATVKGRAGVLRQWPPRAGERALL